MSGALPGLLLLALALPPDPGAAAHRPAGRPAAPATSVSPDRPNVLVVMLDDWGVDRFDAYAPSTSRTPVLDFVASVGLRFERAYTDPVCSPTRAAALTGRLGVRTGVSTGMPWFNATPDDHLLDPATVDTLPELLGAAGYATAAIGKWHLTTPFWLPDPYMHPVDFGFDLHKGPITNLVPGQGDAYDDYDLNEATVHGATQTRASVYATTQQVDDALTWIGRQADRPWFCWLALTAPHRPWDLPPQELVSVDLATVTSPEREYDAVLEAADTEIGRLLGSLRPAVLQRTIVLILGDNGTPKSAFDSPLVPPKKGTVAEGGVHVPLLAWHAGVRPGTVPDLVHAVDLHATILELAGAPAAHDTDSVSFAPLVRGTPAGAREQVYVAVRRPNGTGPWDDESSAALDASFKLRNEDGFLQLWRFDGDGGESVVPLPYSPAQEAAFLELAAVLDALDP